MKDLDEVLARALAPSGPEPAVDAGVLSSALRAGRRRHRVRHLILKGTAVAVAVVVVIGVLTVRSGRHAGPIGPAVTTTTSIPVATTATTAPAPLTASTASTPVPASTSSVAGATGTATSVTPSSDPSAVTTLPAAATTTPAVASPGTDAFAAVTASGKLEVWSATGRLSSFTLPACAPVDQCGPQPEVSAAITDRSIWYGSRGSASLWRAPRSGGSPVRVASLGADYWVTSVSASGDDARVWYVKTQQTPTGLSGLLMELADGSSTTVASDATAVSLSPDGTTLAYGRQVVAEDPATKTASYLTELVLRNVASGAERRFARDPGDLVVASTIGGLDWSADGRFLVVTLDWEGTQAYVVDVSALVGDRFAVRAPSPAGASTACWLGATRVAQPRWSISMEVESSQPGDIQVLDVVTGATSSYGVKVLGENVACRSDGSIALVDGKIGQPGDLVVVRPGGSRTVLERGYWSVVPG
jgi:hypothetical protein